MAEVTNDADADWDQVADVVVIGSGAAGFAAATSAAIAGASVLIIEKAESIGGTTAKSGGYYWIPNNRFMRQDGIPDNRDDALRYMARLSYPTFYNPRHPYLGLTPDNYNLISTFYERGTEALDFFVDHDMLRAAPDMQMPDYSADLAEDLAPYGRHIFHTDTPPAQPYGEPPLSRMHSSTTGGALLIEHFTNRAEALGIPILLEHRAVAILRNADDEVVGIEAHVGRRTVLIHARKGVIFASGGFTHNVELRTQYLRGPMFGGCAAETSTGDFVEMGTEVGAQLGNMPHAWWDQTALEIALRVPSTITDCFFPFGDSMIQVNQFGKRVVNEKMVYNERSQVHFDWNPSRREYSNLLLFQIYDRHVAMNPRMSRRTPVPLPGENVQHVVSGETWDELVRNLDRRVTSLAEHTGGFSLSPTFAEGLSETVRRFDRFAEQGDDEDFGRGDSPIQRSWNGPGRLPEMKNPTMHPFAPEGPYYAIILAAGALDTKGGPKIDPRGRVLDGTGLPIAGLYGAGNCIASPAGQAYWSAGATIGLALTYGYIAGRSAAGVC